MLKIKIKNKKLRACWIAWCELNNIKYIIL